MEENSSTEAPETAEDVETPTLVEAEDTQKEAETPQESEESADDVEELKAKLASRTAFSRKHENRVKELVKEKDGWAKEKLSLEGELHKAKTELARIQKEAKEVQLASAKSRAAADFKLPEKALGYLKGATEEEIKTSAQELAEIFGVRPAKTKLISSQGNTPALDSSAPAHLANLASWANSIKK